MLSKIACLNRWKVASGCTCTLISTVSSNCLPEQMQSRNYWICMLFSSEFSNGSSNCLPVHMHSSIDCILIIFQMFSQIACLNRWKVASGCTCTLISTVSSNCVLEPMQSHIFCIFVLFSRVSLSVLNFPACTDAKSHWWHLYAFSPEWVWMSSNCLPVQMQSHIDCIWTIFHLPSFVCPTQAQ